jgi:DNA-binding MarR family transcriptional regulator
MTRSPGLLFEVFNEIGIIAQLSRTLLEARLPKGLSAPHFSVINHLVRLGDGKTPVEIARAFQVPKTTMTHTLKGLEKNGLIAMQANLKDGRSKQVMLTEAGRAMREETIAVLGRDFEGLADGFGVNRYMDMLPELRALRVYLDENREDVAGEASPGA